MLVVQLNLDIAKPVKPAIYFVTMKFCHIDIWHLACKNVFEVANFQFDVDMCITAVNARQKHLLAGKIVATSFA